MDVTPDFVSEAQLMPTNRRDSFRSVKVTKHGTIRYVRYGFLLVFYSNFVRVRIVLWFPEIFDFKMP